MKPCKRIEIVIERAQMKKVEAQLEAIAPGGYTVLFNAGGSGDRGPRRADDVTDTDENCVFIIAVDDETIAQRIIENIRPVLSRYGGIGLISDAQWVIH